MTVVLASNPKRCLRWYTQIKVLSFTTIFAIVTTELGVHSFQPPIVRSPPVCGVMHASEVRTNKPQCTPIEQEISPSISAEKERNFVRWMLGTNATAIWHEIPHPGKTLEVIGSIPSYVTGSYIKNGPGAFTSFDGHSRRYTHAFDGLARLQKFDINPTMTNGIETSVINFTTRYIDSQWYRSTRFQNTIPGHLSVGPVDPPFSFPQVVLNTLRLDNTCVNIMSMPGSSDEKKHHLAAVTDADVVQRIDLETLETLGVVEKTKIRGTMGLTTFSTAHSKVSPHDGCTYNYHAEIGVNSCWAHIVRSDGTTKTSIGKVPGAPDPDRWWRFPYVHEISMTNNYVVLVLSPVLVDLWEAVRQKCVLPTLQFDDSEQSSTRICLFDIHEKKPVQVFHAPPLWSFHHVNAYEDEDCRVVLDLIAYDTPGIANGPHGYLYMENMRNASSRLNQEREGQVWRFVLDPSSPSPTVEPERKVMLDPTTQEEVTMELTSVAPEVLGRPYRFVYGFTGFYQGKLGYLDWALYKQNVVDNAFAGAWYEEFMYPGEVTFVKDPTGTEEDDGVLLSTVYDSRKDENFLLILDARTMEEKARAYVGVGLYVSNCR